MSEVSKFCPSSLKPPPYRQTLSYEGHRLGAKSKIEGYDCGFQMSLTEVLHRPVLISIYAFIDSHELLHVFLSPSGEGSSRAPGTVHETRPLFQRIINEEDGKTPVRIQEPYRPYPKFSEYTDRLRG